MRTQRNLLVAAALFFGACGSDRIVYVTVDTGTADSGVVNDSGVADTGRADVGSTCSGSICGGECVDLQSSEAHCGACGTACAQGELCTNGDCALSCPASQTACGDLCVSLSGDNAHCGTCETVCGASEVCSMGTCGASCRSNETNCGGGCFDIQTNPMNCGACGTACTYANGFGACGRGTCALAGCDAGFGNCDGNAANGCELATTNDRRNCGGCGIRCGFQQVCTDSVCVAGVVPGTTFTLSGIDQASCQTIEHDQLTGDDRGGIAMSATGYYYSGDEETAKFSFDLQTNVATPNQRDSLFFDILTNRVWTLASASGIDVVDEETGIRAPITKLIALDDSLEPTTTELSLSETLSLEEGTGIFSDAGRVLIWLQGTLRAIDLSTGQVTLLNSELDLQNRNGCENWAFWGMAEQDGGVTSLLYASEQQREDGSTVVRTNATTGVHQIVFESSETFSDMCSFLVDVQRQRFVFHHEGRSFAGDHEETFGYCPATLE